MNYALSDRWSVGGRFGKTIANNDNPERQAKFTNGDLSTGIAFGFHARDRISTSFSLEYNLDQREASISADVSYAWSF